MVDRILLKLRALRPREEGQGTTEYAMVIAFLVVGVTLGLGAVGIGIDNFLDRVAAEMDTLIP